jgi:hypothetical protein
MQGKWDRRPPTEQGRAQVLWRFHEGGGGCRQSGDVLMGEAVANIACDMLGMSLSEVSDEAIGGHNAW